MVEVKLCVLTEEVSILVNVLDLLRVRFHQAMSAGVLILLLVVS